MLNLLGFLAYLLSLLLSVDTFFAHAVVLFRSAEHPNCSRQPGFVRAVIESNFLGAILSLASTFMRHFT
jgi:hypothetical protein